MHLLTNQKKIYAKVLSSFIFMVVLLLTLKDNWSTAGKVSLNNLTVPGNILAQNKPLKTIIVDNHYPYTFANQQGQPDGFSVDLMKAVTQVMGLELEIKIDTWELAMDALETGEIDFLPMMASSKKRDLSFDFSVPHTVAYDAFLQSKMEINLFWTA